MRDMSEYNSVVPADKMPPCPICGKPIMTPAKGGGQIMVFIAHDMAALGHDACKVERKTGDLFTKAPCHVCGEETHMVCSDCAVEHSKAVHVCSKQECVEQHQLATVHPETRTD